VSVMDGITLAAVMLVIAGLATPLLAWAFCTRPAPRWLRLWRDLALALVGVRVLLVTLADVPLGEMGWWGVVMWIHLGVTCLAILVWNHYAAFRLGDRCPAISSPPDGIQ
jgi:hypothetical protein